jgi:multidrug efflux pump subunit AcrA (membrane-fusion protein)
MRSVSLHSVLAILLAGLGVLSSQPLPGSSAPFIPPGIATASDIPYPINTTATGIVTLLLSLDATARCASSARCRSLDFNRANGHPNLDFY